MKTYEEPKLDVIRFEMADTLTANPDLDLSGIPDIETDAEWW